MRTVQVGSVFAAALLLSVTLVVVAPTASACHNLMGRPTECVTKIYYDQKASATARAVNTQAWANAVPPYVAACPRPPDIVIDPLILPELGQVGVFVSDVQGNMDEFQAGVTANPFLSTGALVGETWFATVELLVFFSDRVDSIIVPVVPTLPPAPPEPPSVPDPQPIVDDVVGFSAAQAASLQKGAADTAACAQSFPPIPL